MVILFRKNLKNSDILILVVLLHAVWLKENHVYNIVQQVLLNCDSRNQTIINVANNKLSHGSLLF